MSSGVQNAAACIFTKALGLPVAMNLRPSGSTAMKVMRRLLPPAGADVSKSGSVGHREHFTLLRIDPELVDINTVVLVRMLPSTDTDLGQ